MRPYVTGTTHFDSRTDGASPREEAKVWDEMTGKRGMRGLGYEALSAESSPMTGTYHETRRGEGYEAER